MSFPQFLESPEISQMVDNHSENGLPSGQPIMSRQFRTIIGHFTDFGALEKLCVAPAWNKLASVTSHSLNEDTFLYRKSTGKLKSSVT